jgi:hemolysin activation/secretion protein
MKVGQIAAVVRWPGRGTHKLGRISIATLAGALALAASSQPAFAQAVPPPSPAALPNPAPREVVNPPALPTPPQTEPRVSISGTDAVTAGPCPLTASDVRTTITSVRFVAANGKDLPPELSRLLAGIAPSAGEQPIRVVCELRDQAQARLRGARYVASVQIPQQQIGDGVLQLDVVWGHIKEVRVRGDAGPYEGLVRRRIALLKALEPLNEADAERVLLLADDIPGLSVSLALSPEGSSPGELIGDLAINFERLRLFGNVQNYNSRFLGRETVFLRGEVYGLTGMGDVTALSLSSTVDFDEQKIAQLRHSVLIDPAGDTISLTGTVAQSRPDLADLDLRTLSVIGGFEASHPLVRTVREQAAISGGLEYALQRTRVYGEGGSEPLNRDRIAALYLRLDGATRKFDFAGQPILQLSGALEVRKGLDILGATTGPSRSSGYNLSRFDGDATATVVRGNLQGVANIGPVVEFFAAARGQWADHALLNYDEFSIGNLTILRGYDPGANTGDRAIGFTVEPRANIRLGGDTSAQLFAFYDGVRLWNLDSSSSEKKRYLASLGGGVRMNLLRSVRLDVTYTHALDPALLTSIDRSPPQDRVLASLTIQLVPFGR